MHSATTRILYLFLSLYVPLCACSGRIGQSQSARAKTIPTGTPSIFRADVNLTDRGAGDSSVRFITGYMEGQYFNRETLERLFQRLATEYPEPEYLNVAVYSDEEMVRRMSNYRLHPPLGDPVHNSEDHKHWVRENLPSKAGYYRAYYTRNDTQEFFDYSPDQSQEETVRVELRRK
jgi:hypothetical protein